MAFVIISLVATAIFRLFSGALGNAGVAEEYSRAILIAQSLQAQKIPGSLREGTENGATEDGRMQWTVQVSPYEPPNLNPEIAKTSEFMMTRMYRIVTVVSFAGANPGQQRSVTLSTVRLGPKERTP